MPLLAQAISAEEFRRRAIPVWDARDEALRRSVFSCKCEKLIEQVFGGKKQWEKSRYDHRRRPDGSVYWHHETRYHDMEKPKIVTAVLNPKYAFRIKRSGEDMPWQLDEMTPRAALGNDPGQKRMTRYLPDEDVQRAHGMELYGGTALKPLRTLLEEEIAGKVQLAIRLDGDYVVDFKYLVRDARYDDDSFTSGVIRIDSKSFLIRSSDLEVDIRYSNRNKYHEELQYENVANVVMNTRSDATWTGYSYRDKVDIKDGRRLMTIAYSTDIPSASIFTLKHYGLGNEEEVAEEELPAVAEESSLRWYFIVLSAVLLLIGWLLLRNRKRRDDDAG
jgi:hypothetical protein